MTFEQIKELIELVASHRLAGFEVERTGFRLKIDGYPPSPGVAATAAAPVVVHAPLAAAAAPLVAAAPPAAAPAPAPAAAAPAAPSAAAVEDPLAGAQILTSPIVGTFYRSPNPTAPAFVEVGQRVARGQVVCIVEAMKLMNEIESDVDGVVLQIFPQNAQPVEFGEKLFAIRVG